MKPAAERIIAETLEIVPALASVHNAATSLRRADTAAAWATATALEAQWRELHDLVDRWRAELWLDQDGRHRRQYRLHDLMYLENRAPRDLPRSARPDPLSQWLHDMSTRQPGLYSVQEFDNHWTLDAIARNHTRPQAGTGKAWGGRQSERRLEGVPRRSQLPSDWADLRQQRKAIAGGRCEWLDNLGRRCTAEGTDCDH